MKSQRQEIGISFQNQFIPILLVGSSSCDFRCSFSLRFTRFSQSCSAKKNFLFHWLPKRFYADILLPLYQCMLVERVMFNINIEFVQNILYEIDVNFIYLTYKDTFYLKLIEECLYFSDDPFTPQKICYASSSLALLPFLL